MPTEYCATRTAPSRLPRIRGLGIRHNLPRLIPVKAIPEELPTLILVNQSGRSLMDIINDDVSGKLMVTAFCLLVFGVFLAIVVANLA